MSNIKVWVEASHHAAFRCGGWAYVRQEAPHIEGAAGGERNANPERAALAGLAAALQGLPQGAAVTIASASPLIAAVPRRMVAFATTPPADNLDLWAQLSTALQARAVSFVPATARLRTPEAFAAAWADLARDKAKTTGSFTAAIPRANLAKAGV